jgi:hypothetical protein
MLPRLALTFVLTVAVCLPARAFGQTPQPEPEIAAPAHVSFVEGTAVLEREGRVENAPLNMPLLSGDRLKTSDGRVEVLFADGGALHLDGRTTVDFQSDDLARLIEGRLRLNIPGPARSVAYRIDSPSGSVRISQPGEYRIALVRGSSETQLELAVLRGSAEVFTDLGATPVRAGERAYASAGLAPSYAYAYNSANWDAFDRWSETRRDVRMGLSAQYLPSDMRTYASTFDDHGDWRYEQSYGHVWYPRVAADWRPYYHGRWASYPRYGWTWIGADRFAWPTHHYGRWGFSAGAWFWIPGNRWAPAYVSWGYAPGYVSWCPLGFDNRPVIGINIFNVGPGYYSSWRGWTSVSRAHFGRGHFVHHRAVNWDRVERGRRPNFQVVRSAPVASDIAVPRNSTPIQRVGSRVLPSERLRQGSGAQDGGSSGMARGSRAGSQDGSARSRAGSPSAGSAPSRAGSGLSPSGGRETAVPRGTDPPRYVNRGEEIVRSQTERPVAPRAVPRSGSAVEPVAGSDGDRRPAGIEGQPEFARRRTAPDGPARRAEPAPDVSSPPAQPAAPSREYRPSPYRSLERAQPVDGAQGRPAGPSRSAESPRAEPRPFDGAQGRRERQYEAPVPPPPPSQPSSGYRTREYQPREPVPQNYGRPGGVEARPQPAPERSADRPSSGARERTPPPAPTPGRAAPRETAVPRSAPAPNPSGGGAVARPRGRGGL